MDVASGPRVGCSEGMGAWHVKHLCAREQPANGWISTEQKLNVDN